MDVQTVIDNIREIASEFAKERGERQLRRDLRRVDFDRIKDSGYLLTAVPVDQGGIFESVEKSPRPICDMLRTLAHGDPSIALVSAMHPAVIGFGGWLNLPKAPEPYREAWEKQRRWVFQTALDGCQWGTIVSEPGSGGDTGKTIAAAKLTGRDGEYLLSGEKHFGSGSGMTSFMVTTAIPEGESEVESFFMDMRGVPWDGSAGVKLAVEWDGWGMTATQSHAMTFQDFPVSRSAWHGIRQQPQLGAGSAGCMFTAVIVGVIEVAVDTARQRVQRKGDSVRAYEQTEWAQIELESWLIHQAYEGMLRSVETGEGGPQDTRLGKEAVAQLAETVMLRICKVIGGGSYSRHSPFGYWLQDVRALGFLRPPWGLAFDQIFQGAMGAAETVEG
jgi:alkylation response protein AidB-like acyl-CoA dehydrogenase